MILQGQDSNYTGLNQELPPANQRENFVTDRGKVKRPTRKGKEISPP